MTKNLALDLASHFQIEQQSRIDEVELFHDQMVDDSIVRVLQRLHHVDGEVETIQVWTIKQ